MSQITFNPNTTIKSADVNTNFTNLYTNGAPKRSRVYKSTSQSITSGVATTLTFDAETFDTDTFHDTVTNNSRLTIPTNGVYLIKAQVAFASNSTGVRQAWFLKNGVAAYGYTSVAPSTGDRTTVQIMTLAELSAADYIEVQVDQGSGGALNVEGAASDAYYETHFEIIRLSSQTL